MNSFDQSHRQESLKRRSWQEMNSFYGDPSSNSNTHMAKYSNFINSSRFQGFPGLEDGDLVSSVVPPVTVVLEGRSICHRISLCNHDSYQSLAKALRQMFVDTSPDAGGDSDDLDLSNAIPGHLIAYEDMENDLLLAGDLSWKDFVRVAKRIRILPAKGDSRKGIKRGA
ncbi:hypothetical protein L6164_014064 [Bauhinia variegata]|uniref:Uncharacterized protein n=1 Tax=Bauhinia variegata TaxID=167791 RepID=A0ACB9NI57_BAUVA|nr:hypothetical protein L6164_014064 [Bauhinia variegata]